MNVEQSETITELIGAMHLANSEVTHPKKGSVNPHFKSNYADLTTVIDSFRAQYLLHGLVVTQMLSEGQLVTQIMHISGQWMRSSTPINADKSTIQAFCSSLTYLRRYTLQALVGVSSELDDDGNAAVAASTEGW